MENELTSNREAENIINEAQSDTTFLKMLKFKQGDYWCGDEEIPLGTVYLAHCKSWTKSWIHFENRRVVERRNYKVAAGEKAPERDRMPNNDQETWPPGPDGKTKQDPWAFQYLLPFENQETGEVQIFVAQSFGGRRAVSDLCTQWGRRILKNPKAGQPIIKIGKTTFPSKNFGDVKAPVFEVIGWDDTAVEHREVDVKSLKDDMNDEIPF